ncbi:MAG: GrpB family protein [Propioniciclava sp.]|uniref:GrpB family protein n=1 Tax=Propioniciclava sp. TaxID=2038686 RepID=UPI0039E30F29
MVVASYDAAWPDRFREEERRLRPGWQAFNAHVVEFGGSLWRDNLLLRDHLRSHPADAERYARVKQRAATKAPDSLIQYSELKRAVIEDLIARARRDGS